MDGITKEALCSEFLGGLCYILGQTTEDNTEVRPGPITLFTLGWMKNIVFFLLLSRIVPFPALRSMFFSRVDWVLLDVSRGEVQNRNQICVPIETDLCSIK